MATYDCKKEWEKKVIKITAPAHIPINKSTLVHIIKDAELTLVEFMELL